LAQAAPAGAPDVGPVDLEAGPADVAHGDCCLHIQPAAWQDAYVGLTDIDGDAVRSLVAAQPYFGLAGIHRHFGRGSVQHGQVAGHEAAAYSGYRAVDVDITAGDVKHDAPATWNLDLEVRGTERIHDPV